MELFNVFPPTQNNRGRQTGELASLLPECNLSLDITGFEAAEIDTLLCDFVDPEQDVPDAPHTPPKQRSVVPAISDISATITSSAATLANAMRALMNQKGNGHVETPLTSQKLQRNPYGYRAD
jgi:hypothetical protein